MHAPRLRASSIGSLRRVCKLVPDKKLALLELRDRNSRYGRLVNQNRTSPMANEYIADLKKWVGELIRKREAGGEIGLNRAVDLISKHYSVHHHEVAIFVLSDDARFLKFVVPEKLQAVGQIPLTSTNSLAARTARDKRPEVINHFSVVPHASVFEAVPLVEEQRGDPIQKIMSAPM